MTSSRFSRVNSGWRPGRRATNPAPAGGPLPLRSGSCTSPLIVQAEPASPAPVVSRAFPSPPGIRSWAAAALDATPRTACHPASEQDRSALDQLAYLLTTSSRPSGCARSALRPLTRPVIRPSPGGDGKRSVRSTGRTPPGTYEQEKGAAPCVPASPLRATWPTTRGSGSPRHPDRRVPCPGQPAPTERGRCGATPSRPATW